MNKYLSLHIPQFSKWLNIPVQILVTALLLMSACALLKERSVFRSDSLMRKSGSIEMMQDLDLKSRTIQISNHTDSSSIEFYTEIFPQGSFSYSPMNGFNGQAEMVRLSGKMINKQKILDSSETDNILKLNTEQKEIFKTELRTVNKEKRMKNKIPNWVWITGVLILIGLGIVYRRRV